MQPLQSHRGIVALLDRANVDTDQIIPKQFLKSIKRTGFGEYLFFDWRYLPGGKPNPEFELNRDEYHGATILITRNNFGCGSSREHAVWAIAQYGFRVIVAPWAQHDDARIPAFADIFRNNCVKNGVLTVELDPGTVDSIFQAVRAAGRTEMTVSLADNQLWLHVTDSKRYDFDVDPAAREQLLRGLDDIDLTLQHEVDIAAFESGHDTQLPS